MIIRSVRMEIKPGVERCVQVQTSGKACITLRISGKNIHVAGDVVNEKFKALPQYQRHIDAYIPTLKSFRGGKGELININMDNLRNSVREKYSKLTMIEKIKFDKGQFVSIFGEIRKLSVTKTASRYSLSYKGIYYQGKLENGVFVVTYSDDHRYNKNKPKFLIKNGAKFPIVTEQQMIAAE